MATDQRLELRKNVPLFSWLGRHKLVRLGELAHEIDVPDGPGLMRQGESGQEFFGVLSGHVIVARDEQCLVRLGPFQFRAGAGLRANEGFEHRTRRRSQTANRAHCTGRDRGCSRKRTPDLSAQRAVRNRCRARPLLRRVLGRSIALRHHARSHVRATATVATIASRTSDGRSAAPITTRRRSTCWQNWRCRSPMVACRIGDSISIDAVRFRHGFALDLFVMMVPWNGHRALPNDLAQRSLMVGRGRTDRHGFGAAPRRTTEAASEPDRCPKRRSYGMTSNWVIIPESSCSRMWQWKTNFPRLSVNFSLMTTVSPMASCHDSFMSS